MYLSIFKKNLTIYMTFSTELRNSERSLDELLNESKLPAKIIVKIKQDLLKAIGTFLQKLNKKLKLPTRFVKSPELHTIIVSCASAALKMNDTSSGFGKKTKRKRRSGKKKTQNIKEVPDKL
jgi:predicted metal-dependent hydrolase